MNETFPSSTALTQARATRRTLVATRIRLVAAPRWPTARESRLREIRCRPKPPWDWFGTAERNSARAPEAWCAPDEIPGHPQNFVRRPVGRAQFRLAPFGGLSKAVACAAETPRAWGGSESRAVEIRARSASVGPRPDVFSSRREYAWSWRATRRAATPYRSGAPSARRLGESLIFEKSAGAGVLPPS